MSEKKNLNIQHTFWQILHNQCSHTRSKGKVIMTLINSNHCDLDFIGNPKRV